MHICLNIDKTLQSKRQDEMNLRGYVAQWFLTQALCQNHIGSFTKYRFLNHDPLLLPQVILTQSWFCLLVASYRDQGF